MSDCKIGLVECKYPNTVIKTCHVCVRQQFEDEILAIKEEAYQQGRADLLKEFKENGAYDVIRADEREKVIEEFAHELKETFNQETPSNMSCYEKYFALDDCRMWVDIITNMMKGEQND